MAYQVVLQGPSSDVAAAFLSAVGPESDWVPPDMAFFDVVAITGESRLLGVTVSEVDRWAFDQAVPSSKTGWVVLASGSDCLASWLRGRATGGALP